MRAGRIQPQQDLFRELNEAEQPGRYIGGEFGSIKKPDAPFRIALAFPDLYEIGMSNTAIKILYGLLNQIPQVSCERVFVPAPDFEVALERRQIPLYTLETGCPLNSCDMVAVSFSYELLATNLLTLLKSGHIPLHHHNRGAGNPLVVIGGPGATNPAPYGRFIEGAFIGEAEEGFIELAEKLATLKSSGASRDDLLHVLQSEESVWFSGKTTGTRRALWRGFSLQEGSFSAKPVTPPPAFGAGFPVPSIPVVQDHGVVEIMRGCPQGCRFCHAGVYYRPYRMKGIEQILREADWLVHTLGYREISLSSLSSGDYGPLQEMMGALNSRYRGLGVSLQLPSLRVDSFTLPILEQLSTVRRAGLTFAVESAGEEHQTWTNKRVPLEKIISIAREARARGWRRAKLYFMIGLPGPDPAREAQGIVEYVCQLRRAVPMEYIVNVGTFVPKPHTPFQWEAQLDPEEGIKLFREIRSGLPRGTKLKAHDPWMSWLEGVLARGDDRVGEVIESAHNQGARLDAWTDYLRLDIWKECVSQVPGSDRGVQAFSLDESLPWNRIDLGISSGWLKKEHLRARKATLTERCLPDCQDRCGVCRTDTKVAHLASPETEPAAVSVPDTETPKAQAVAIAPKTDPEQGRSHQLLLAYTKQGSAAFLPHLAVVRTFERLWYRLGLPVELSLGHHPKPKMSFGQPLPIGIESLDEIGVVNLQKNVQLEEFSDRLFDSSLLPEGLKILKALTLRHVQNESRIPAPMQLYNAALFLVWVESRSSQAVLEQFLEGCAREGGVIRGQEPLKAEVLLPREAPGFGRLLKECGGRGIIRGRRLASLAPQGEALFDWYRSREENYAEPR
ncbi:radical SAM-linked protein [Alkalispirochaeta americana]|uniref:Radical SAM-linked protein n=1 Tax=Alkalispirochaeta americana TaxID=159291 RepID=A0A1N6P6G6_9SPIO|nr:TIGR03936 family radical SAM-associated protein [Alkalispirochaeta americana]SIP99867.1 radical SAM-linked protein [Alkalispirochaeta americana]